MAGLGALVRVEVAEPDAGLDGLGVLQYRAHRLAAADLVAERGGTAVKEPQLVEAAAGVVVDAGAVVGQVGRLVPDLAVQLADPLFDAQFDGELAQVVEILEEYRVREADLLRRHPDGVAVEVDEADAALGVGVPQESGGPAVGDHDQVAQHPAPGRVGPGAGHHGGRHGERADHPALDVGQAGTFVAVEPFHHLA